MSKNTIDREGNIHHYQIDEIIAHYQNILDKINTLDESAKPLYTLGNHLIVTDTTTTFINRLFTSVNEIRRDALFNLKHLYSEQADTKPSFEVEQP